MSEIRNLLGIKTDTFEPSQLSTTSFIDCPNKCIDGFIMNPYTHKKEICSFCQDKRKNLIKYSHKNKLDGKTMEETLRLPKSFSGVAYDIDNIIPASAKKEIEKSSFDSVLETLKDLMNLVKNKELPSYSMLFNLGKKAYEGGYIYSLLANAYISGLNVAPYLSAFDIVDLRLQAEKGYDKSEFGVTFKDLLNKDLVVVVIEAGATSQSILSVKGLMQMRAVRELPTIIFTNSYGGLVLDLCDEIPTYNLAKLCSIEYNSKTEVAEVTKPKPVANGTASMTAEQFKNLYKSY